MRALKQGRKRKNLTPLPTLVKRADVYYSRYIRLRDSEYRAGHWVGQCISCGRKLIVVDAVGHWNPAANAGHYISRGKKYLRWNDDNVHMQCARCNAWEDKVKMISDYRRNLCFKIGERRVKELETEAHILYKPSREELQQVIADAKEYVSFTLAHPEGLEAV